MNWKECVRLNEETTRLTGMEWPSRFGWPAGDGNLGFDCNPAFTFNDVWGAISWVWTWPGDYLLNLPVVKSFFELGPETIVGSGWSTALGWVILAFVVAALNDQY